MKPVAKSGILNGVNPVGSPPADIQAEQALLGSMLIEPAAVEAAQGIISCADLSRPTHQIIFDTAVALHGRGEPADMVTVRASLEAAGALEAVGGVAYMMSLFDAVPTAANVRHYAGIVADKARQRRAWEMAQRVIAAAEGEIADTAGFLKQIQVDLDRITQDRTLPGMMPRRRPLAERVKDMANIGPPPTDLPLLWWVLTEKSTHWLAAPSGVGKSTVAFNIVTSMAEGTELWGLPVKRPCRILYCDLESGEYILQTKLQRLYMGTPRVRGGVFFLEDFDVTAEMNGLVAFCRAHSIDLVVFDTAAKTWSLRDENDNSEVGRSVTPILETLKRAGFASLVIDHTGKNAKGARGASSKSANVDVVLELDLRGQPNVPDARIWFECHKHKLLGFPPPLTLRRIGDDQFERVDTAEAGADQAAIGPMLRCRQFVLDFLQATSDGRASFGALLGAAEAGGFTKATLHRALKSMEVEGDLLHPPRQGYALPDPFADDKC